MRGVVTIREHQRLENKPGLTRQDAVDLEWVARKVLKHKDGDLAASNFVGVVTTRRGLVLEILPKIDLGGEADPDDETTRQTFLRMLRSWRGLGEALPQSGIRAMPRFPMLDVFVRQFLINVSSLAPGRARAALCSGRGEPSVSAGTATLSRATAREPRGWSAVRRRAR